MQSTGRDYADKPSDAVEFLNNCAVVFVFSACAAGLGIVGYSFTLFVFSL